MEFDRTLHLINFDEPIIVEQREHYPRMVATDELSDMEHLSDVTVVLVRTEADALRAVPIARATAKDLMHGVTLGSSEVDPCVCFYMSKSHRALLDKARYEQQTVFTRRLVKLAERYPRAIMLTDGYELGKTIRNLVADGRNYLQARMEEEVSRSRASA